MNKFRMVVSVVIMVLAAVVGMFVGMAVNEGPISKSSKCESTCCFWLLRSL